MKMREFLNSAQNAVKKSSVTTVAGIVNRKGTLLKIAAEYLIIEFSI
jgi:hypothetical protein